MPIYTYRCELCDETFDKRQSFHDAALSTHETDGGTLRKVLHPAGIVFKGSGFYNTDYKNGSAASGGKDDAPATPAASETSSESKGESKSDSKSDAAASSTSSGGSDSGGASGSSGSGSASSGSGTSGASGSSSAAPAASSSSS